MELLQLCTAIFVNIGGTDSVLRFLHARVSFLDEVSLRGSRFDPDVVILSSACTQQNYAACNGNTIHLPQPPNARRSGIWRTY